LTITGSLPASVERIGEIAGNLAANGRQDIAGYDAATVRTILLDDSLKSPYPAEAPEKYAGM
jgi:hypothetical protein